MKHLIRLPVYTGAISVMSYPFPSSNGLWRDLQNDIAGFNRIIKVQPVPKQQVDKCSNLTQTAKRYRIP